MIAVASRTEFSLLPEVSYRATPWPVLRAMAYDGTDRRMSSATEGLYMPTSLMLRKLPLNTTKEAVRTMLVFAKDLQATEIVSNEYEEDQGFATAIARFSSVTSASEAQSMLDGKPNTSGHANMIVEMLTSNATSTGFRRNTIDPNASRPVQAASPMGREVRYNNAYDSFNKLSPPPTASPPESVLADGTSAYTAAYSQHSPRGAFMGRVSGKSVIGEEGDDEDPNDLLMNPGDYMKKDRSTIRRPNGYRQTVQALNSLSLNTAMAGSTTASYHNPRSAVKSQPPHTPFSPNGGSYMSTNPYIRHNYPPVNPADQNPPCNTLYVGNLPMDTSEDELKAMFSKQRGYRRLCFRTKQNGPMCFVEFEDISFATKALNDLYGAQLHNSVKGGIRLSFSKNPLGVRSGQPGSNTGPSTPLNASGPSFNNAMAAMSPGGFSSANGPPPGLSAPSGFLPPNVNAGHQYVGLGMRSPTSGSDTGTGSTYPDYMLGR